MSRVGPAAVEVPIWPAEAEVRMCPAEAWIWPAAVARAVVGASAHIGGAAARVGSTR